MIERLNIPVSVLLWCDHTTRQVHIRCLRYDGRDYDIRRVSYRFTRRAGRTLLHIFSAVSDGANFKLALNTDSLVWTLEEIHAYGMDTSAI